MKIKPVPSEPGMVQHRAFLNETDRIRAEAEICDFKNHMTPREIIQKVAKVWDLEWEKEL